MSTPDKALEAARKSLEAIDGTPLTGDEELALSVGIKAAIPIIQSDALRTAASCMRDEVDAAWLESWADELDKA